MITKYKVTWYNKPHIEKKEIEKETPKMVVVGGIREHKISEWHYYADTFEDAKIYLLDKCMTKKENAKIKIEYYEKEIEALDKFFMNITNMKEYKED